MTPKPPNNWPENQLKRSGLKRLQFESLFDTNIDLKTTPKQPRNRYTITRTSQWLSNIINHYWEECWLPNDSKIAPDRPGPTQKFAQKWSRDDSSMTSKPTQFLSSFFQFFPIFFPPKIGKKPPQKLARKRAENQPPHRRWNHPKICPKSEPKICPNPTQKLAQKRYKICFQNRQLASQLLDEASH